MFVSDALPEHLKDRYEVILEDLKELQEDYHQYKTSQIPTWFTIPRYSDHVNLVMDNDDMQTLAENARNLSVRRMVVIRSVHTPMGALYAFREDILDAALNDMTEEDDE